YTALVTGAWAYTYDGTGATCGTWPCTAGKRTYVGTSYDSYGNRSLVTEYGDYDTTGDERTTRYTYVPNTSAYIVGRPAVVDMFDGNGTGGALLKSQQYV